MKRALDTQPASSSSSSSSSDLKTTDNTQPPSSPPPQEEPAAKKHKKNTSDAPRTDDWVDGGDGKSEEAVVRKAPKRKVAVLFGYNGGQYAGLQVQTNMKNTIEYVLEQAMFEAGCILPMNHPDLHKINWTRCARTDKGVHAACNVVSCKLMLEEEDCEKTTAAINAKLPADIRVFSMMRVRKQFHSKNACSSRFYEYLIPSYAFDTSHTLPFFDHRSKEFQAAPPSSEHLRYRLTPDKLKDINEHLAMYIGTKNYHNFTSQKHANDPSCKRYILSFEVTGKFLYNPTTKQTTQVPLTTSSSGGSDGKEGEEVEFVRLGVQGQSFLFNMIRKMVGNVMGYMLGLYDADFMSTKAFSKDRVRVPLAPALGLLLDRPDYSHYDEATLSHANAQQQRGLFSELYSTSLESREAFKRDQIYRHMFIKELEFGSGTVGGWLRSQMTLVNYWGATQNNMADDREAFFPPKPSS